MPNPVKAIAELLAETAEAADVLPASGGAVMEERAPDADEREEAVLTGAEAVYDRIGERCADGSRPPLYKPAPPVDRRRDHLFRYFVDGSFRSYFLGTLVAPEWESPVCFGQAGACVLKRSDDGTLHSDTTAVEPMLVIAKFSDALWERLEHMASARGVALVDLREKDQLTGTTEIGDLRAKATSKVRWRMHVLEARLIEQTLPKLDENTWLIADGSLRFEPLETLLSQRNEIRPVIGVAKSFRRDVRFRYGRGPRGQTLTLYRLLADLKHEHRTVAFAALDGRVVFWYVRLREQRYLDYPLMGVVKAELINPTGEAVSSELIDRLSCALVAERSATPHGRDRRWHAHLYPIYVAETVVRQLFLSPEVIRAALLWR